MRLFEVTLAVAAGLVSCTSAGAQAFQQIPLTYNADVVREAGGTVTGGLDQAGRAYVSQGEAALRDNLYPRGLPDNGILTVPGGTLQLGPYNGNNAILMTPDARSGFVVAGPQAQGYDYLMIYAAGSGFAPIVRALIDYEGSNGIGGATPAKLGGGRDGRGAGAGDRRLGPYRPRRGGL